MSEMGLKNSISGIPTVAVTLSLNFSVALKFLKINNSFKKKILSHIYIYIDIDIYISLSPIIHIVSSMAYNKICTQLHLFFITCVRNKADFILLIL